MACKLFDWDRLDSELNLVLKVLPEEMANMTRDG